MGDSNYRKLRGRLALSQEKDGVLPLTDLFGLHPAFDFLHQAWRDRELAIIHAAASAYRGRSHFDGQDLLETGQVDPDRRVRDGWIGRALNVSRDGVGLSIGPRTPLIIRGSKNARTFTPSRMPSISTSVIDELSGLYAFDPLLSNALMDARANRVMNQVAVFENKMARPGRRLGSWSLSAGTLARLMCAEGGADIGVLSFGGWDTHANQGARNGRLANMFRHLDDACRILREEVGALWEKTTIVIVTEFGRTARSNGTMGTDHGTGGAAFVLGGAVNGGRVYGDWPGLADNSLFENRDLYPANDVRRIFANLLETQFEFDRSDLRAVFPDGAEPRPFHQLIK